MDSMLADMPVVTAPEIHIDEELLDEYVLRRCDARAQAAVAQHLAECRACMAKWIELAELRAALAMAAGSDGSTNC